MIKNNSLVMDNIGLYEELLNSVASFYNSLGLDKDIGAIFANFIYMYKHGYLSWNHSFCKRIPNSLDDLDKERYFSVDTEGIFLMLGYGVCRHISDFLNHLYSNLGYESGQVYTFHPSIHVNLDFNHADFKAMREVDKWLIETFRNADLSKPLIIDESYHGISVNVKYDPIASEDKTNHVLNSVLENDKVCVLDAMNTLIGEYKGKKIIKLYDSFGIGFVDTAKLVVPVNRYYDYDVFRGAELLNYPSCCSQVMESFSKYYAQAAEYKTKFEEFWSEHQKLYEQVHENTESLVRSRTTLR